MRNKTSYKEAAKQATHSEIPVLSSEVLLDALYNQIDDTVYTNHGQYIDAAVREAIDINNIEEVNPQYLVEDMIREMKPVSLVEDRIEEMSDEWIE